MCKFLTRIFCAVIVALILFVIISFNSGGKKFRWFGKKVEEQSEKIGEKADSIKEKSDSAVKGAEKMNKMFKDLTGNRDE